MNIRLTNTDLERIGSAQQYFASLRPVPVHLGNAEVVRVALRELVNRLDRGGHDQPNEHETREAA